MDLNSQLKHMKDISSISPDEKHIKKTAALCQDVYYLHAQEHLVNYWEFLWNQLPFTRKRWWCFQAILLFLACLIVPELEHSVYQMRSIGVVGCLFIVLTIPELWRNKESGSTQVEAACLYSLQQVYAARITLFGIVDVALLTVFICVLGQMGFSFIEVLSQFLLPVTVTACICFSILCGKTNLSESVSIAACLTWGGIWWLILMNEMVYQTIIPAVWIAVLGLSLGFLIYTVRRTLCTVNQYWEEVFP